MSFDVLIPIIAVAISVAIFMLIYSFAERKDSIYVVSKSPDQPGGVKILSRAAGGLHSILPVGYSESSAEDPKVKKLLMQSGNPWKITVLEFKFIRFITAIVGAIGGLFAWIVLNYSNIILPWPVIVGGAAVIGFFAPLITYREAAAKRNLQFMKELPDALDLIAIAVGARTSLNEALRSTVEQMQPSALRDEFSAVIRSIDSGKTMRDALEGFADRAPNDSVLTFVRSLQEANELETSMVETLKSRSEESRNEMFSYIRSKAALLESKMSLVLTFPLVFCLIIIILAPMVPAFNSF